MLNNIKLITIDDYVKLVHNFLEKLGTDKSIIEQIKTEDFEKGLYIKLPDVCVLNHSNRLDGSSSHQTHIHITSRNMNFFYNEEYIYSVKESTDDIDIPIVLVNTNIDYLQRSRYFRRNGKMEESEAQSTKQSCFIETNTVKKISKRNNQSPQVQLSKKRKDGKEFKIIRDITFTRDIMLFLKYKGDEERYLLVVIPSTDYVAYDESGFCEVSKVQSKKGQAINDDINEVSTILEENSEYRSDSNEIKIDINQLEDNEVQLIKGHPSYIEIPNSENKKNVVNKKRDYINDAEKKMIIGNFGEKHIFKLEKLKLQLSGYGSLAEKVKWISKEDDSKGYDILSYEVKDNEIITKYIEVKTTVGADKPFEISKNEIEMSKILNVEKNSKYVIARVFNINIENGTAEYYFVDGQIEESFNLIPTVYKAYYKKR
ncbi:protein of unknown function [Clostridium collagenovorans DSM 3089]|uniref:Protein NO VEIN C-terminal domain-containing protein n=1 Tax=Clostridium collagenovorans DSM 3089 TaxID=1121306 RepID=A0A1M5YLT7_9CLOT|nr:DUF3883 domain-containing protein [Clostridium collagenovorans]SHI12930.1 protein of unknown function [Clostridium collagenovorans DSM 3089]